MEENKTEVPFFTKIIVYIAIAGVTALGSGVAVFAVFNRICDKGLERVEGECIDPYLQTYENAVQIGKQGINLGNNYQDTADLETAKLDLENAIAQLQGIPQDALVFQRITPTLEAYQNSKKAIEKNLTEETAATTQLDAAIQIAESARFATDSAKTKSELSIAKQQWENAISMLRKVPVTKLSKSTTQQYQSEYQTQIADINQRITALTPKPQPKTPTYKPPRKVYTPPRKDTTTKPPKTQPKTTTPSVDICASDNPPQRCLF